MRKTNYAAFAISILMTGALLGGCGATGAPASSSQAWNQTSASFSSSTAPVTLVAAAESDLFTSRDLEQRADLSQAKEISVSSGGSVSIKEAGVYILSGTAENASVVVEAGDEDKVQLVLKGLKITNAHQACILVENADKVFITSAEGSDNSLTVSGKFTDDNDAVIFSKDDLVINGLGKVTINSTKDGIRSNDDLKLTGGTWTITAEDTAMKAHESIYSYSGVYELTGGSDGLHAENNDDDTKGDIIIKGGNYTIKAGDDGVHGTTSVTIDGGSLTITAGEGIEATQVLINDGTLNITASDDGINAGQKSKSMNVKIEINGGDITVVMGSGDTDGIDSNGDLIITGGTINVTGQSPFDYDGNCTHTGGKIIVNGTETETITNQMMGGHGGGRGGQMGSEMGGRNGNFGGGPR
ncbi:MAG: carbohydrate-binding domain-containing protein [Lachnospiraceae bacterium]|nr:carbohydrate-binding domain-containing protein [Lachnospiraceae bacterium]